MVVRDDGSLLVDGSLPVDDLREILGTPRLPDEDRRWYSLGLTWNVSDSLELNAAYTLIQPDKPKVGIIDSQGHVLFGSYSSDVNLFGMSGQYRF